MPIAITDGMDDDRRYELPCRIGLLAAAAVHWATALVFIIDWMNADGADVSLRALLRSGFHWSTGS